MEFQELKEKLQGAVRWIYIEYISSHKFKFIQMWDYEDSRLFKQFCIELSKMFGDRYKLHITMRDKNNQLGGEIELSIGLY